MMPKQLIQKLRAVAPARPAAGADEPATADQMHHPVHSELRAATLALVPGKLAEAKSEWLNITPFESLNGHAVPDDELPMLGMHGAQMRLHNLHATRRATPSVTARMWQNWFYTRTYYLLKYSNVHLFKLFAAVPKEDMSLTFLLEAYGVTTVGAGQSDRGEFTIGEAGSLCKWGSKGVPSSVTATTLSHPCP